MSRLAVAVASWIVASFLNARSSQALPSGDFGLDLASEPKYVVGISTATRSAAMQSQSQAGGGVHHDGRHQTVSMTNAHGQKFKCVLPDVPPGDDPSEGDEGASPPASPDDLLSALGEQCFYRVEGWWTYEYCHRKHVRQFHKDNEEVTADFWLGKFDAGATGTLREQAGGVDAVSVEPSASGPSSKYVALVFTGGTVCDLTGDERRVEVRFFCGQDENTFIANLKEPATCKYTLQVNTPVLCRHPSFGVAEKPVKYIQCTEVAATEAVEEEERVLPAEQAVEKEEVEKHDEL